MENKKNKLAIQEELNQEQFSEETVVKDAPEVAEEKVGCTREELKEKEDVPVWKSVLMGALPGAVIGVAGVSGILAHQEARAKETPKDEDPTVLPPSEEALEADPVFVPMDSVEVAGRVDDSMSFAEAFRTARAEVGPGGAFTWHGEVYSTYYGTEWNSMSPEDQSQYGHAVSASDIHPEPWSAQPEQEPFPNPEPDPVPDVIVGDIEVVAVETVETPYGDVDVAHGSVGEHAATFFDLNQDDVIDSVAIDANDNLVVEEDEIYEPADDIHMSDLASDATAMDDPAIDLISV